MIGLFYTNIQRPDSVRYRYGFNGKEKDPEGLGGGQITLDYGFRVYNPALGKFLSVDPLANDFPWYTPYQYAGNKPIWKIDLDGLEEADSEANSKNPDQLNSGGTNTPQSLDTPSKMQGSPGMGLANNPSGLIDMWMFVWSPTTEQAENFADAVDGEWSYWQYTEKVTLTSWFSGEEYETDLNKMGRKVVLNDDSPVLAQIKEGLKAEGIDYNSLSLPEQEGLKTFYWKENEDRSDLFWVNLKSPKLAGAAAVRGPYAAPMVSSVPLVMPNVSISSTTNVFVNAEALAKERVLAFAKTKKGKSGEVKGAEHTKGKSKRKEGKHQKGQERKQQVNRDKKRQKSNWKPSK